MTHIHDFLHSRRQYGITPGLERMDKLLKELSHPEEDLRVIHIAGTNGKGSTQAFLQHALMENGYTVGTFSSPALEEFHEQFKVNNVPITETELNELGERVQPVIEKLDEQKNYTTEFEVSVLLAILYMQKKTDLAIFETGMGGKEDATNCLFPILSIITNIEKDHVSFLGETYEEIAAHKAGIIKSGAPLITGNLQQEAQKVVAETAIKKKVTNFRPEADFSYQKNSQGNGFIFRMGNREIKVPQLAMAGDHQMDNAALALASLEVLKKQGWNLDRDKVVQAIAKAVLPGRFEILQRRPVVIVDSAHNPAGIASLIKTISQHYPNAKKHMVFAAFQDKDLWKMTAGLNCFETVVFTSFSHPRAAPAVQIYQLANLKNKKMNTDWKAAISQLQSEVNPDDLIIVTGSLNFIGQVRKWLKN